MIKKLFLVFFSISFGSLLSQTDTISYSQYKQLQTKKVKKVDSLKLPKIDQELPSTLIATQVKDTLIYELEDLKKARKIDSIWLASLYNNDLFEDLYGSVTQMEFTPVDYEELPTELLKQRLEELNARTPFHVEYNPSLESVIKGYLKNRRATFGRLMALSDYYFPMFEEEMARQGLPMEMKYLAIIESALDPTATSRVGAKGLWQFMFQTGKIFGLDVNSYVDERCDPLMATEAAAKYLNSLYKSLGDWDLALAAYNSGPGNVSKAIRRSGGKTNYWNIREFLPRETAGYLPAFFATMYIFEFAEEHGFKSNGPKFPFIATDTLKVKKMITLEQVAKVTNLPIEEVTFLNPSYKLGIIPVIKDENYVLRLPKDAIGKFVHNEQAIYALATEEFNDREKPLPNLFEQEKITTYRVRSGDYLGKIATKYGVGVSQIKRWNNLRSNNLKVGQRLKIYTKGTSQTSSGNIATTDNTKIYTVKAGDTLWDISKKFPNVSVEDLKKWNGISGSKLQTGMKLKISKS